MNKKEGEQGSAIILAILLLAFFMALSMNMFFIAREKSKNAGVKAAGVRVLSNIDGGASVGYYELALASNYVTEGEEGRGVTTEAVTPPLVAAQDITWISPDGDNITDNARQGVLLANYLNFMGTRMNAVVIPARKSTSGNGWLERENTTTGNITTPVTEMWSTAPAATENDEIPSVGGYKIMRNGNIRRLQMGPRTGTLVNVDTVPAVIPNDNRVVVRYVKRMRIRAGNDTGNNIGDLSYRVECERTLTMNGAQVDSDELTEILVTFEN